MKNLCPAPNKRNLGLQAKRQQLSCCHGIASLNVSRILFYNLICGFPFYLFYLLRFIFSLLTITCSANKGHPIFFVIYVFLVWLWVIFLKEDPERELATSHWSDGEQMHRPELFSELTVGISCWTSSAWWPRRGGRMLTVWCRLHVIPCASVLHTM